MSRRAWLIIAVWWALWYWPPEPPEYLLLGPWLTEEACLAFQASRPRDGWRPVGCVQELPK